MSQWRGRLEDNPELESAVDWVTANWHVPVVALLLVFMLWNRVRSWDNFVVDGEILFRGNDPWYHYRSVTYTVQNWPATMPFDPWTNFPQGTSSGQFGTLFDQIIATAALIVGLGDPSSETIKLVLLFAPAVFGVAAGIPTYIIGRRLGGRIGGITAVAILAFAAGSFLSRSMVGFSDHHVAEALFMTLGILGVMVAVTVADRDKPIYEQVVERDFDTLRPTLVWSVLAGFAVTLYLWVWPFGVLLVGLLGTFFLIQLSLEFLRGESPEHTAFAGAVAMGTAGILLSSSVETLEVTASDFSLLQPALAFGVAAGCVFMAWLAREWENREYDRQLYPLSVGGIIVLGVVLVAALAPELYSYFTNQILRIFGLGFTTGDVASTVGEAQPLVQWGRGQDLGTAVNTLYSRYGFAVFVAFIGGLWLLARQFWREHTSGQELLVVVWAVFMIALTFTQQRFMYYLIFPLSVLTGFVVNVVIRQAFGEMALEDVAPSDIDAYQAITIVAIVLILGVPLFTGPTTAMSAGSSNGPGNAIAAWDESLDWMADNTPEEGAYGEGGNGSLEYYGTYARQDDYDYQSGEYGVMSWWDYGHWITAEGERVPNANPFQQGAQTAAEFLISQDEDEANQVLEEADEDDAETRYVNVDWKMVRTYGGSQFQGKFFAPSNFVDGVSSSDFYNPIYYELGQGQQAYFMHQSQDYYNSTVVRLYQYHGSAVEPEPVVVDWDINEGRQGPVRVEPEDGQTVKTMNNMSEAREYVANDSSSSVGGVAGRPAQRVEAMENYRLVGASERSATDSNAYNLGEVYTAFGALPAGSVGRVGNQSDCDSEVTVPVGNDTHTDYLCVRQGAAETMQPTEPRWTKVFERVPGATIEGQGPASANVTASVQMQMPNSSETFVYTQQTETDENGNFEMTVPYSTTGYDEWGTDEGYTNVSVRANSSYQVAAVEEADNGTIYRYSTTADVTEGQVIGEDEESTEVDMERTELFDPDEATNDSESNETTGNETIDSETTTNETTNETSGENATGHTSDENATDGGDANSLSQPDAPEQRP